MAGAAAERRAALRGLTRGRVQDALGLLVLFVLHTPILKPDFDLALGEVQ